MKFITIIALISLFAWSIQSCAISSTNCNFYQCLENNVKCGTKGYPLGYGYKYCTKFGQNNYKTDSARRWTNDVRQCLQSQLTRFTSGKQSCSVIETSAFNSHPYCYTNNGICHLVKECLNPFNWGGYCSDVATIVRTVDVGDLMTQKSIKQMKDTLIECTRRGINFTASLQKRFSDYVLNHFKFDDDDEDVSSSLESFASFFDKIEAAKLAHRE